MDAAADCWKSRSCHTFIMVLWRGNRTHIIKTCVRFFYYVCTHLSGASNNVMLLPIYAHSTSIRATNTTVEQKQFIYYIYVMHIEYGKRIYICTILMSIMMMMK